MIRLVRLAPVLAVAFALTLAGCGAGQPALANTSWRLTGWAASTPIPAGSQITAKFDNAEVSGSTGVNTYSGAYTSGSDGSIRVASLRMTLIGSTGDQAAAEQEFTNRLQAARGYKITGDTLVLTEPSGKDSLTFTRTS